MHDFTPIAATVGGALIGLSAAMLMLLNGRVAGVSGIAGGLLAPPAKGDGAWRAAFVLGLVIAGIAGAALAPESLASVPRSTGALIAAGVLVGVGTRVGNGCTSGHGVCGLSRMSGRSLAATLTFMFAGVATVFVTNHVLGGAL